MAALDVRDWRTFTDTDLLAPARAGDKQALVELIRRREPLVCWVIRQRLDQRCLRVVSVEDVVQELRLDFLTRAIAPEVFARRQAILNYLLQAAANKAQDVNRRWLGRSKRSLSRDSDQPGIECPDPHTAAGSEAELEEELIGTYFHLPEPVNHVYFIRMQGGTPEEIGQLLEMSLASVYRALAKAEERLRARLG